MIRKIISIILVAVLALSCASGCTQDPVQPNGVAVKQELTLDTAAISSCGELVETENGYYYSGFGGLVYADKSDLTNWVLVCNDPTCDHTLATCPAKVFGGITIQDGRIFTMRPMEDFQMGSGFGIFSMTMDGTDLRFEHAIEAMSFPSGGYHLSVSCTGSGVFYCGASGLQTDGTYLNSLITADKASSSVLMQKTSNDQSNSVFDLDTSVRGDLLFYSDALHPNEDSQQHLYRITEDGVEDGSAIAKLNPQCGYLSGDNLYHYISGKGYYWTQISSGTSQKWMDAQLDNGIAYYLTDGFIVEHNMTYGHIPEKPQLLFYDGESWAEIELPADWVVDGAAGAFPLALTTEHIFFNRYQEGTNNLYFVNHTDPDPVLTLCGQF